LVAKNQKVDDMILLGDATAGRFDRVRKIVNGAESDQRFQKMSVILNRGTKGFAAYESVKLQLNTSRSKCVT